MTDEMKETNAIRYMVIGTEDEEQKIIGQYENEAEAKKVAEERAAQYDNAVFSVYQFIGSAKLEHKVAWKGASR